MITTSTFNADDVGNTSNKIMMWAMIISVAAHLVAITAIKYSYLISFTTASVTEDHYIDLGYETFDEVPEARPVVTRSEEIQDSTGEVQSLQKEKSSESTAPSDRPTYADVPYYKIKPKYPRDALESGLEGHVKMTIDILEDGTVDNIKVTGGEKVGVFESAAMRSVSKWKYKPFTDANGNPIKMQNYLVQVDFKIRDEIASN